MKVCLIQQGEANTIRRMARRDSPSWGDAAEVVGSGRTTCRACGRRIARGAAALVTLYSFDGSGFAGNPWCAQEIHIHVECPQETL
jgi:hypothetical protein